jgi:hypothetical protein
MLRHHPFRIPKSIRHGWCREADRIDDREIRELKFAYFPVIYYILRSVPRECRSGRQKGWFPGNGCRHCSSETLKTQFCIFIRPTEAQFFWGFHSHQFPKKYLLIGILSNHFTPWHGVRVPNRDSRSLATQISLSYIFAKRSSWLFEWINDRDFLRGGQRETGIAEKLWPDGINISK